MATQQEICEMKVRYLSRGAALSVRRQARRRKPDMRYFAYYCEYCRGYHLSTVSKRS